MLLFFGGIMIGAAIGLLVAALIRANDDDVSRGHPL